MRDIAYAQALEKMHAKYPADDEIAIMYALSLLGGTGGEDDGLGP